MGAACGQAEAAAQDVVGPPSANELSFPARLEGDVQNGMCCSGLGRPSVSSSAWSFRPTYTFDDVANAAGNSKSSSFNLPGASRNVLKTRSFGPTISQRKSHRVVTTASHWRAQPQKVGELEVWPKDWGMTREQLKDLLHKLRADAFWDSRYDLYTLVEDFIVPWTKGAGLGYALMVNQKCVKEVNVMVSHAWGENAEEFLEALIRSTRVDDVMFICAFSLYQAEDDAGPGIAEQLGSEAESSPFSKVITHIQRRGEEVGWRWRWHCWLKSLPSICTMLAFVSFYTPTLLYSCVPSFTQCAKTRFQIQDFEEDLPRTLFFFLNGSEKWEWEDATDTAFPFFLASALLCGTLAAILWFVLRRADVYMGRMIVVPNREVDVYGRLWCVFEIFVASELGVCVEIARTLAKAGKLSSKLATCGYEDDMQRINSAITSSHGYDHIDQVVSYTTREARWNAVRLSLNYGTKIALFTAAYFRIKGSEKNVIATLSGIFLACFLIVSAVYATFRHAQGIPTACSVVICALVLVSGGMFLELIQWMIDPADSSVTSVDLFFHAFLEHLGGCLVIGGSYIVGFLVVAIGTVNCCQPRFLKRAGMPMLVIASIVLIITILLFELVAAENTPFYPALVTAITFVAGFFVAPAHMCWSAAMTWGVRIRSNGCC